MASISAFDGFGFQFDYPATQKMLETQRLIEKSFPFDTVNNLLGAQQALISLTNSPSFQALQGLNMSVMSSSLMEFAQQSQRISALVSPVWEQLQQQSSWLDSIIPSIDFSLRESIAYSYSELTQAVRRSALFDVLGRFDELDIPICSDDDISHLSNAEKNEIANDIAEAVDDPLNWEQRLMATVVAYQNKHPIQAWVLKTIVLGLILNIMAGMFTSWLATLLRPADLREEPSTDSASTYRIPESQVVEVVGDEPYYYLVEFENPETKEILQGYVSKRSVRVEKGVEQSCCNEVKK